MMNYTLIKINLNPMNKQTIQLVMVTLLAMLFTTPLRAQKGDLATRINPILSTSTARDGHIAFDTYMAPLKTARELMNLRGMVSRIIQKSCLKSDYLPMNSIDTIRLNPKGHLTLIRSPKSNEYHPDWKYSATFYRFHYKDGQLLGYTFEDGTDNSEWDRPRLHRDVWTYEYDQKGRLWKEWEKVYFEEKDGKMKESHQGFTKDPQFVLEYDLEGRLDAATVGSDERLKYDANGRLMLWMYMNSPETKASEFQYDQQGRLTGTKYYSIDGMDEAEYYELNSTITYNEQGDIAKIVTATWLCNSKWVHKRKVLTRTTNYSYTYDQHGNWTRVNVSEMQGGRSESLGYIERTINYW